MYKIVFFISIALACSNSNKEQGHFDTSLQGVLLIKNPKATKTLFIVSGYGEKFDSLYFKIPYFEKIKDEGFNLVFIDSELRLYIEEKDELEIENLILKSISQWNLEKTKIHLLGFSLGGTACLKVISKTNLSSKYNIQTITIIDPPLDYYRLYNSLLFQSKNSKNIISINESNYLSNEILKTIKPKNDSTLIRKLWKASIISKTDTVYKNYKTIKNNNILIFTNNDTNWQAKNRDRRKEDMNFPDCILFYNEAKLKNCIKLELLQNTSPSNNPHSRNNVDYNKLIEWIKE